MASGFSYGTIRRSESGFTFSRGRGAARTVSIIGLEEIVAWAKKNKTEMAELAKKAAPGRAAEGLRKQLVALMKTSGGQYGVAKFADLDDFTKRYKTAMDRPLSPIGAGLGKNHMLKKWVVGGKQYIGWTDGSKGRLAEKFQAGEGSAMDPFVRGGSVPASGFVRRLYAMGFDSAEIPQAYRHVERDVINQFSQHIDSNLAAFKRGVLEREIAKRLAVVKGIAIKRVG